MAMTSNDNASSSGASHRARWLLAAFAVAAIAAPAVYFSRGPAVQAEDPPKAKIGGPKEPDVEFFPKPLASEEKVLAALEQPTTVDFHESPLQTVVDYLKDLHSIEIQLDVKALEDGGMGTDTPVSRKLSGISLRSALRLLLGSIDLTFIIKNEVLLITTKEVADAELVTRTYPVADLTPGDNYESLVDAITTTVLPQSWNEVGGPGRISPVKAVKSLVISQTQDAQDEALQLLRSLRAARKAGGVEWSAVQTDAAAPAQASQSKRPRGGGVRVGTAKSAGGMGDMGGGMGGGMGGMGGMGGGMLTK
jgi:hypothetical protein